jgi:hypothetical protein
MRHSGFNFLSTGHRAEPGRLTIEELFGWNGATINIPFAVVNNRCDMGDDGVLSIAAEMD